MILLIEIDSDEEDELVDDENESNEAFMRGP